MVQKVGILLSAILTTLVSAELQRYEFTITRGNLNPDCHEQGFNVPMINGQFPGPTIYATEGDEVEILVHNQMDDFNASIHYHGIQQRGTIESDGVPGITQFPITPGNSYLQKFKVTQQSGTYFYHAHVGLQDDSVQGSFIVYESNQANPHKVAKNEVLKAGPYEYKKDLVLQLSEWWHEELASRQDYYLSNKFAFDHGADSILMNGRTVYDPSKEGLDSTSCQGYTSFDVEPNSTYRLRVIGGNTFRTLALAIKDHNMTMIEVDGELVHPHETSYLEMTPGQRFSVLLKTGDYAPGTTFAIGTSYLWRQRGGGITENGFGFIRYVKPSQDVQHKEKNDTKLFKTIKKYDTETYAKRCAKRAAQEAKENPAGRAAGGGGGGGGWNGQRGGGSGGNWNGQRGGAGNWNEQRGQGGRNWNGNGQGGARPNAENRADTTASEGGRPEGGWPNGQGVERPEGGARPEGGQGGGNWNGAGQGNARPEGGARPERGQGAERQGGGQGGQNGPKRPASFYEDLPIFPRMDTPDWVWPQIKPLSARNPIVDAMDVRTIKLHTSYMKMPDNTTRYMVNKRLLPDRYSPLVNNIHASNYTYTQGKEQFNHALNTYRINHGEIVDFVFQNTKSGIGGCLLHPWHTHGHSHYVIASGAGDYNHDVHGDIRNFENPLYKDTTVAYPSVPTNDTDGCGWTKVRILADNPGFWAVHCHITTHMIQGKMVILEEAPELIERFSLYRNSTK